MKNAFVKSVRWLLPNVVGVVVYLAFVEWLSMPRPEIEALNFDSISTWMMFGLPVLLGFAVVNFIWLTNIRKHHPTDLRAMLVPWLTVCVLWAVAIFANSTTLELFWIWTR